MSAQTTERRGGGVLIGLAVATLAGGLLLMRPVIRLSNQYLDAWHRICAGSGVPDPVMSSWELPLAIVATLLFLGAAATAAVSLRRLGPGARVAAVVLIVVAVLAAVIAGYFHVALVLAGTGAEPAHCAG